MNWTPIGLGTWNMETRADESIKAIHAGLDAGANHIDTAEMYGEGRVEEIVGRALKGRRPNVILVSKVLPSHARYDDTIAACEQSLKRLGTDYLDVYLLHWREKRTPMDETFRAFEKLKSDGKIRNWGVSNFDVEDLEDALEIVGPGKIVCNQVLYHLKQRSIEDKLIPWSTNHDIPIVAYSPLGQGKFSTHSALDQVAQAHQATPAQIALAFLIRNPNVFAIPKSSSVKRTIENVKAMKIRLSNDDIEKLNAAFPAKTRRTLPMI